MKLHDLMTTRIWVAYNYALRLHMELLSPGKGESIHRLSFVSSVKSVGRVSEVASSRISGYSALNLKFSVRSGGDNLPFAFEAQKRSIEHASFHGSLSFHSVKSLLPNRHSP